MAKSNHQTTDVIKHSYSHLDHLIDFKNLKILSSAFNHQMLIKDTLLIQEQQPKLNTLRAGVRYIHT